MSKDSGVKFVIRHRCMTPHTSVRSFIACTYPSARVAGAGHYALVMRCGGVAILQYRTSEAMETAKAALNDMKCNATCSGDHTAVRFILNPHPRKETTP